MISSLRGKVSRIWGNWVEIEVGGVGYQVQFKNQRSNIKMGDEVKLRIHTAVSENDISLFGFETDEELDLFRLLITVSGVGPRTAAQILAAASAAEVVGAIGEAEVDFFKKIKGIGLKTAQRIIVDLKSKIGGLGELNLAAFAGSYGELKEDDVVLSLRQLGFERKEIERTVRLVPRELQTTEERLGWCLRNLGR